MLGCDDLKCTCSLPQLQHYLSSAQLFYTSNYAALTAYARGPDLRLSRQR